MTRATLNSLSIAACLGLWTSMAAAVLVPDNGSGTAGLPLQANYTNPNDPMFIINGLPPGDTIEIDAVLVQPLNPNASTEINGGGLGGTRASASDMQLQLSLQGTGSLSSYSRTLVLPPTPILLFDQDNAPRVPNTAVQTFATDVFRLTGQIASGDPDFDLLRITAGSMFGMPSPGSTTLIQSGPNWDASAFFDINYRIDFVGKAGGTFGGMSGSTTEVSRFVIVPEPGAPLLLATLAGYAILTRRRHRSGAVNG